MLSTTTPRTVAAPALPAPRGALSAAVLDTLRATGTIPPVAQVGAAAIQQVDPYGEDLQLALYCCYELHYRGFAEVSDELEWDPDLLRLRRQLERAFLNALRSDVPGGTDVAAEIDTLLAEPLDAWSVSHHLRQAGQLWQLREYIAQRSLYHLKEADPHAWTVPRLTGPAKVALVTVEYDEYGSGNVQRNHAQLFADMMIELGLCAEYGAYLDAAAAPILAEINFMSLCGLHRSLRAALIGQLVTAESTSSPSSERLVRAMRRLGCKPSATEFFAEHIEADAVHEQLVRHGILAPLLTAEPQLAGDVVFGIQASTLLGNRLSDLLLRRWAEGRPTLRHPLPDAPH